MHCIQSLTPSSDVNQYIKHYNKCNMNTVFQFQTLKFMLCIYCPAANMIRFLLGYVLGISLYILQCTCKWNNTELIIFMIILTNSNPSVNMFHIRWRISCSNNYYLQNKDNILTSSKRSSMNSLHTLLWHMVSAIPPPPSKANDLWCW